MLPNSHFHMGASEAKRSEAVVWGLLGVSVFFTYSACLVLLVFLSVACSCRLSQIFLTDASKILMRVGASEAKRSEAVVWGLWGYFFINWLLSPTPGI